MIGGQRAPCLTSFVTQTWVRKFKLLLKPSLNYINWKIQIET